MRSINLGNFYTSFLAHLLWLLFIMFCALTAYPSIVPSSQKHNPGYKLNIPRPYRLTFMNSTS